MYSFKPILDFQSCDNFSLPLSVSASLVSKKAMWIASKIEDKSENRVQFDCYEKLHEKEQHLGMSASYLDQHPGQL